MRSDFPPVPRPSVFSAVRKAAGSIFADLLFAALLCGAVVATFYALNAAISYYPVTTIVAGLVISLGGAITWRAIELYEREQNELIDQGAKHPGLHVAYDGEEDEVIEAIMTKLHFTREQAETWARDHWAAGSRP